MYQLLLLAVFAVHGIYAGDLKEKITIDETSVTGADRRKKEVEDSEVAIIAKLLAQQDAIKATGAHNLSQELQTVARRSFALDWWRLTNVDLPLVQEVEYTIKATETMPTTKVCIKAELLPTSKQYLVSSSDGQIRFDIHGTSNGVVERKIPAMLVWQPKKG